MVLQAASDWALRRLLKVLLKKSLKHVFATELDVEQLRVSLGSGTLELADVLLAPDWLAQQAPPGLEVASGYIGRLAISVAVTSLTCAVHLEDVLITVRPGGSGGSSGTSALAPAAAAGSDGGEPHSAADQAHGAGAAGPAIDDGVRLVATGVETLLQRMTVTLSRLSVRVEGLPGGGDCSAASLTCAQVSYGAAAVGPDAEDSHAAATSRRVAFAGLSLAAAEGCAPLLAPMGGEAEVRVAWPLDRAPGHQPAVSLAARLDPVQLQLRPPDVVALAGLARSYAAAAAVAAAPTAQQQLPVPALQQERRLAAAAAMAAVAAAGHRSFLEELMLPGCSEELVADALAEGAAGPAAASSTSVTGQEEVDEFYDAKSLLGSLQEAFASAMSASGASASWHAGASTAAAPPPPGAAGALDLDAFAMHDLAASLREVGAARGKQWRLSLAAPSVALALLYPEAAGCGSPHFAPRLAAEAVDLAVHVESGDPSSGGGPSLSASVGVVEVAEQLPFPASPASSAAAARSALGDAGWLPAEEMARVPGLLPGARHIQWAAPASAGDYPLPGEGGSLGSTLEALSGLSSQATLYQSAAGAGLEGSIMLQSSVGQGAAAVPRVQIVPVLRCGSGQSGAALALLCTSSAAQQQQQAGQSEGAAAETDVSLLLQPVSMWCTLPLLARLQSFVAPVASELAAAAEAAPVSGPQATSQRQQDRSRSDSSGSGQKAAVAAAISDIMQQQQQQQQQQASGSTRVSLYLPAACVVVAVPAPDPALPRYFAADVRGSSSQLLASMAPRLGSQAAKGLFASLVSSGVEPTIVLQPTGSNDIGGSSGGGSGGSSTGPDAAGWACAICAASLAVHAVQEAGVQPLGETVLGPALSTAQVACIDGSQPDQAALREQLSASAPLLIAVRAAAPVQLALEQPAVAAASRLADALLQLSAAQPPLEPATQAAVLVDCDVLCTLSVPQAAPFTLTARSARVVACSSLGGVAGSSVVAVAVGSLELARSEAGAGAGAGAGGPRVLALAAGQQLGEGQRRPALQLLMPLRPTGEPYMLCSNGRYVLPCRGRAAVATAGLTVLLDESGQLGWLADLQAAFAPGPASSIAATGCSGAPAAGLPPPPPPALEWGVSLVASSVRYEPRDTRATAAVLTVGGISCRGEQGPGLPARLGPLELRRLALHVAAAGGSGGGSGGGGSPANGQGGGLAGPLAELPGFHQVASEPGITIQLPAPQQQQQQQQGQGQQAAMRETVVTNRGLSITLSRHTLLLLQGLVRQLPSRSSNSSSSRSAGSGDASGVSVSRQQQTLGSTPAPPRPAGGEGWEASGGAGIGVAGSSGAGGLRPAVDVMAGVVQRAYASPPRRPEHPLEASVFLDGGWYDPQERGSGSPYAMSPAGSPPAVVESFMEAAAGPGGRGAAATAEGHGVWYGGGGGPRLQEDYAALQAPSEEEVAACFGSPGYDCRVLPPDHPPPTTRLSLRDLSVTVTLADTFTTVLLPEEDVEWGEEEEEEEGGGAAPGSLSRELSSGGSGGGRGRRQAAEEEAAEELVVPLSAQVQARLEGLCLQLDAFAPAAAGSQGLPGGISGDPSGEGSEAGDQRGAATTTMRLALRLRDLEVRDSFQPRKGSGAGGAAPAATGWAGLRRTLGYHATPHRPRGAAAAMAQLVVEAVAAEPGAEPEYRLHAQLLPLLLHLDQAALAFLQHFFAPEPDELGAAALPAGGGGRSATAAAGGAAVELGTGPEPTAAVAAAAAAAAAAAGGGGGPYFQRCEVQPFTLTIRYRPHRVDLAALRSGQLAEVLNLVPWGGISLQFRHLRLFGMQGGGGVATAVASGYLEDIARHQAHRFVGGIAPIQSICRVAAAAAQLVAIPRQQLYARASDGSGGGLALAALADASFQRQMQRGLLALVRAVALEACNLGATMAAGAEVALGGEPSASHTAGVKAALRQASAHLRTSASGGGGARGTASAAATAVRTALLGMRNSLDRQRALERRLNL